MRTTSFSRKLEYSVAISFPGLSLSSHISVHHILCGCLFIGCFLFCILKFLSDTWYRFQLKQEQENRRNATMMYNTTRDKLRRTEEQHQLEVQERQKVELTLRNLELEMRTLVTNMKQVHPLKLHLFFCPKCALILLCCFHCIDLD